MSLAPRITVASSFWQAQAQRFGVLRQRALQHTKRPLDASYHPDGGWGLEQVLAFAGRCFGRWLLDHGPLTLVDEFKSIAGVCAVAVGAPNTDYAWAEWLDCLRRESIDFEPEEVSASSWAVDPRPEPDFEVVAEGLLWVPPEIRPDPEPALISYDLGKIADVCGASERVCRRLADEALKIELETSPQHKAQPPRRAAANQQSVPPGVTVTQPWESKFVPDEFVALSLQSGGLSETTAATRKRVVEPLLAARGWSTLDWSKDAGVDYNTANGYLNAMTKPRRDTRKKLAHSLGIGPMELPD